MKCTLPRTDSNTGRKTSILKSINPSKGSAGKGLLTWSQFSREHVSRFNKSFHGRAQVSHLLHLLSWHFEGDGPGLAAAAPGWRDQIQVSPLCELSGLPTRPCAVVWLPVRGQGAPHGLPEATFCVPGCLPPPPRQPGQGPGLSAQPARGARPPSQPVSAPGPPGGSSRSAPLSAVGAARSGASTWAPRAVARAPRCCEVCKPAAE